MDYGNGKINHIMYADDVVLFAPTAGGLQCMINICEKFGAEADLIYNEQKSVCLIFSKGHFAYYKPKLLLNGKDLVLVDSVRYLGHILTSSMSDVRDIDRQIRSIYCRSNILIKKFYRCSDLMKCILFKTFCSNFYCCALWIDYPMYKMNRLHVAYNNSVRRFLCLPMRCSASLMYTLSNIPSPNCIISKSCFSLYSRVRSSEKDLTCSSYARGVLQRGSIASHWMSLFVC